MTTPVAQIPVSTTIGKGPNGTYVGVQDKDGKEMAQIPCADEKQAAQVKTEVETAIAKTNEQMAGATDAKKGTENPIAKATTTEAQAKKLDAVA